jgi:hypothetical protein
VGARERWRRVRSELWKATHAFAAYVQATMHGGGGCVSGQGVYMVNRSRAVDGGFETTRSLDGGLIDLNV